MSKKEEWELERERQDALKTKAMKALTQDQLKVLDETYVAISEFVAEYSEMFDVTSENARKLQHAFWGLRHQFNKGQD